MPKPTGRPPSARPLGERIMIRMAEEDVGALDRLVAAIAEETKAAGTPPPTRGSVIRAMVLREIAARGLDKPAEPKRRRS